MIDVNNPHLHISLLVVSVTFQNQGAVHRTVIEVNNPHPHISLLVVSVTFQNQGAVHRTVIEVNNPHPHTLPLVVCHISEPGLCTPDGD